MERGQIHDLFCQYLKNNPLKASSFHPHFEEALNYMLEGGGKHFRAQLLLGAVFALDKNMVKEAFGVGAAIEMLHTYSLIHDDLPAMDNSPLRRGKSSVHVKYDEVTAILVGDGLNTQAFYAIATSNLAPEVKVRCVEILAQNGGIGGMVLGQALDCFFEDKRVGLDELKFIHLHKTGALIAAALQMGAVIGGADLELDKRLYQTGLKLGLAFQINDDIIDATSSQSSAGKPVRNDTHKNSYTNLLGINGAKEYLDELKSTICSEVLQYNDELKELILNLIKKYLKG